MALEEVSFEVRQGESFAVIGPNGAGKTTALKLIARISYPTSGRIRVRGRVGALIEVGSGVHPELTGRENIWLYGQILGMDKAQVRRRFDEIVEFAELSDVLDRPVKMYSSGMQLRLGFSIASHLDPEIFVVDEALAVGDAAFQTKCVERMTKLVVEGRALLFVSHNLSIVEAVCERGIFLLGAKVQAEGDTRDVLRRYLEWVDDAEMRRRDQLGELGGEGLVLESVSVHDARGTERYTYETGESLEIHFRVRADRRVSRPLFSVGISDGRPGTLVLCSMLERSDGFDIPRGRSTVTARLGPLPLGPRAYELWMSVREETGAGDLIGWNRIAMIRVAHSDRTDGPASVTAPWYSPVRVAHEWTLKRGLL